MLIVDSMAFSATQVTSWTSCQRKWGWTYIMKIRSPPGAGMALGTKVHSALEEYLRTGYLDFSTEAGEIAVQGIEFLPEPGTEGLIIEEKFVLKGRHEWLGFKDLEWENKVYDHKTTSDLRYAKEPEDLLLDPQAILYAFHNGADPVELQWTYFQTKKSRKARKVTLPMTRAHATTGFEVLESVGDSLQKCHTETLHLDDEQKKAYVLGLQPTSSECEKYGGCPYRGLCNLSPEERKRKNYFSGGVNPMSGLFEKLAKKNQEEAAVSAPEAVVQINPPEDSPPPLGVFQDLGPVPFEPKPAKAPKVKKQKAEPVTEPTPDFILVPPECRPEFTVYVNCNVVGANYLTGSKLYELARERIKRDHGKDDYRFFDYGQGPAVLCLTVGILLDEMQPCFNLVIDTSMPETQACLSMFLNRATKVVR